VSGQLQLPSLNVGLVNFGVFAGPLTLVNSWVAGVDAGMRLGLFYTRDTTGRVTVSGNIRNGTLTAGTVITTLPVGYRPSFVTRAPALMSNGAGAWTTNVVRVSTNGDVAIDFFGWPSAADVQLDFSFMAL